MKRLLLVGALMGSAVAQSQFEVASVKRGRPDGGVRGGCHGIDSEYTPNEAASAPPLGRCVIRDGRLGHLIFVAFGLHSMGLITGGPDWVKSGDERFNIEAKVDDPTKATQQELDEMLQRLLTERFSLKFRREQKDVPGFALIVAKNGPKLRETKVEEVAASFGAAIKPIPGQPIAIKARKYSMPRLADLLTRFGPRQIIDATGLTGAYDFELSWDDTAGPSLFSALQEQLGLRLEPRKVPVSYFVIDSAQRPTEN